MEYKLKSWMFKKGLRSDCMFCEKLGLEKTYNLGDFLNKAQLYINYK